MDNAQRRSDVTDHTSRLLRLRDAYIGLALGDDNIMKLLARINEQLAALGVNHRAMD